MYWLDVADVADVEMCTMDLYNDGYPHDFYAKKVIGIDVSLDKVRGLTNKNNESSLSVLSLSTSATFNQYTEFSFKIHNR